MIKLAEEILSEIGATRFKWDTKGCNLLPSEREKILLALIDERLFEVLQFIQDIMKYDKGLDGEIAKDLYESLKVD